MQETKTDDVIEIDLMEVFMLLLRRWWLIMLSGILVGAAGYVLSTFVIPDEYESTTALYIMSTQNQTVNLSDIQMGSQLTKDYPYLIVTRDVLEKVIDNLGLDVTYESLVSKVDVTTPTDTRIVSITVTDQDPYLAQAIANEVREVARAHIIEVTMVDAVNVASEANLPDEPSAPSVMKWTLIGAMIGIFICAGFILLRYLLDDSIKTADDVERYLGLSTLGMIPINNEEEAKKDSKKHLQDKSVDWDNDNQTNSDAGLVEIELQYADGEEDAKAAQKANN